MQRKKHIFGFLLNIKQHHILLKATLLSDLKMFRFNFLTLITLFFLNEVKVTISSFLFRYVFLRNAFC